MSRPDVVTLHGWAMHGGLFDDLVACWPDARWHRFDLPGHGRNRGRPWPTDVDELLDDIAESAPRGSWLMGWSLGGLLALQAWLGHRDRFAGLALISATPCFVARSHWPHGADGALVKAMALELAGDPETVVQRFLALEIHGSANARDELRRLRRRALQHGMPDKPALLAGLKHLAETDVSQRLDEIDCPVLLIGGRRDKLVPFAALEAMDRALPRSRLHAIQGAAHAPFLADAAAVAGALRDFAAESAHA
jgi:pimeloyl-[acyl-carrier protein] methyl ester esterase